MKQYGPEKVKQLWDSMMGMTTTPGTPSTTAGGGAAVQPGQQPSPQQQQQPSPDLVMRMRLKLRLDSDRRMFDLLKEELAKYYQSEQQGQGAGSPSPSSAGGA